MIFYFWSTYLHLPSAGCTGLCNPAQFCAVLKIRLRASSVLGKYSTNWDNFQAFGVYLSMNTKFRGPIKDPTVSSIHHLFFHWTNVLGHLMWDKIVLVLGMQRGPNPVLPTREIACKALHTALWGRNLYPHFKDEGMSSLKANGTYKATYRDRQGWL